LCVVVSYFACNKKKISMPTFKSYMGSI
jgi:hypothetical protein